MVFRIQNNFVFLYAQQKCLEISIQRVLYYIKYKLLPLQRKKKQFINKIKKYF